jgi:hypothetical protein
MIPANDTWRSINKIVWLRAIYDLLRLLVWGDILGDILYLLGPLHAASASVNGLSAHDLLLLRDRIPFDLETAAAHDY